MKGSLEMGKTSLSLTARHLTFPFQHRIEGNRFSCMHCSARMVGGLFGHTFGAPNNVCKMATRLAARDGEGLYPHAAPRATRLGAIP